MLDIMLLDWFKLFFFFFLFFFFWRLSFEAMAVDV